MNTILASLNALPKLVSGNVVVVTPLSSQPGKYIFRFHKPVNRCKIEDNYNPMNYSILSDPKYQGRIVYSTLQEQEDYLVKEQWTRINQYQVGRKIHLFSKHGTYTIVRKYSNWHYLISCKKWETLGYSPREIHLTDIKCLAYGIGNE